MEDRYLGDGVYASFDGFHVILDLRAQDNTTRIALEFGVVNELKAFARDAFAEDPLKSCSKKEDKET